MVKRTCGDCRYCTFDTCKEWDGMEAMWVIVKRNGYCRYRGETVAAMTACNLFEEEEKDD